MKSDHKETSLILAIKNGDEASFDCLFRKYYPILVAYANRFIHLEDAESIVQDLMIWIWENRESIIIESSLKNYLFRSTYNRVLNAITKKEVEKKAIAEFYLQQELSTDISYFQIEQLTKKLKKLSINYLKVTEKLLSCIDFKTIHIKKSLRC